MEITDFSSGQIWSILPEKLDVLHDAYESIRANGVESATSILKSKINEKKPYQVVDGIAIIPISGPISKSADFYSYFFDMAAIPIIEKNLEMALADKSVEGIVLDVDSPGGTIPGVSTLSEKIFAGRKTKPIVSFSDGLIASAAYWIGSAASKIIIENTTVAGSIGMLMVHVDSSKQDERWGEKRTYITAGKYKAIANDAGPLTKEALGMIQEKLDYYYTIFSSAVSRNLGFTIDLEKMADGKTFIGQQALDVGLVHEIGNIDTAVNAARKLTEDESAVYAVKGDLMPDMKIETIEQLAALCPNLVTQLRTEGRESVDTEAIKKTAKSEEMARVVGLVSAHFGEKEGGKIEGVIKSGITVEQFTAIKALQPVVVETPQTPAVDAQEQTFRDTMLGAIHTPTFNPGANSNQDQGSDPDFMTLVTAHKKANTCGIASSIQAIGKQYPAAHKKYLIAANAAA